MAGLAALALVMNPALHANQHAGPTAQVVTSERLEEVIVSARRRDENLQDVGVAITVIDGTAVERLQLKDARDLVLQIPNLQMQTSFAMSNPAIFMRGVGVNDASAIASGAVSFYLDEVNIGSPAAQLLQFFDLERVEVLRGPQGTLYGRNTPAGAVNFLSRDPGPELDARFRARYGRFNERVLEGAVGGPLSETASGRLAFLSNQRDGHVDNLTLGTEDSDVDNWAARGAVSFQPTSSVEWLVKLYASRSDSGSKRNKSQGLLEPQSVAGGMPAPCPTPAVLGSCSDPLGYVETADPYSGNWNRSGDESVDFTGGSVQLTWDLANVTLHSVTAYGDASRFVAHDADGSPNQLLEIDWQDDSEQWSQEFRLSSAPGERLQWIAGLHYFDRSVSMRQLNDVLRELRPVVGFNPMLGVFSVTTDFDADISASAAFGQASFQVAERTRAILGLRYTSEEHKIDRFDRIEEPGLIIPLVQLADRVRFDDISGKVGIEYLTSGGNLLYGSISRGFKSGGFNGSVAIDPEAIPPFDEEIVLAYEAGFKWTSTSGRLRVNATGFYYDYRDLQVFTRVNTGGIPREVLTNAADANIYGLELELFARAPGAWDLQLAVGLLETELEDFQTFGGRDFSGNELVYSPTHTVSGLIGREWRLNQGRIAIHVDFHYQDDMFFDTSNNPLLTQGGYSLWNGRLSYRPTGADWELALWGKNLGDTEYKIAVVELADFGFNNLTFGEPRTWGLEFLWAL